VARRVAFLIGNQKFLPEPDSGLQPLEGPEHDLGAFAPLLRHSELGNFVEVHEFPDKSHHEILPALEKALISAASGDLFLIYYSGHGMRARNGELYLATADTRQDALRSTSIPTRALRDLVADSDCEQVVLLLDCCYSGAVGEGYRYRGVVESELPVVADASGFYMMTAGTGTQAVRERPRSSDGKVMGRFTAAIGKQRRQCGPDNARPRRGRTARRRSIRPRTAAGVCSSWPSSCSTCPA
jgi:uncharacterized caspase-like protein